MDTESLANVTRKLRPGDTVKSFILSETHVVDHEDDRGVVFFTDGHAGYRQTIRHWSLIKPGAPA
jgi:hypothetical protein